LRKLILLVAVALAALPACTDSNSSNSAGSGGQFTNCDFDNPLKALAVEPGSTPKPLTNSRIDRLVEGMPTEIRPDVRVILETGKALTDRAKELKNLPSAERERRSKELSRVLDNPEFTRARTNYENYVREHCK
jgi:hypothetical protein